MTGSNGQNRKQPTEQQLEIASLQNRIYQLTDRIEQLTTGAKDLAGMVQAAKAEVITAHKFTQDMRTGLKDLLAALDEHQRRNGNPDHLFPYMLKARTLLHETRPKP